MRFLSTALCAASCAFPAGAQSNAVQGRDIAVGELGPLSLLGRVGTFPTGKSGFAMGTTSCNPGSLEIPHAPQELGPVVAAGR